MGDSSRKTLGGSEAWTFSQESLQRLLNWLDGADRSDGQAYVEMRRRLRDYFARKNCPTAEDLADETLTRVARRLEEEGITHDETPARYCYIVARFVFLEYRRGPLARTTVVDLAADAGGRRGGALVSDAAEIATARERLLACLEKCTEELDAPNRRLITSYYVGSERVKIDRRRELARSLGVSMNALSIRAYRIRARLQACVKRCTAS